MLSDVKKRYYSDQALVVIVCAHHVCVLFCILSPLPVWSLLSSYFCRWTTSNKMIGISPCWLLFTEARHIWTINDLAPDIVLKPNVNSFRSMFFTVMWGTRLRRMSANVFGKSSFLLDVLCPLSVQEKTWSTQTAWETARAMWWLLLFHNENHNRLGSQMRYLE